MIVMKSLDPEINGGEKEFKMQWIIKINMQKGLILKITRSQTWMKRHIKLKKLKKTQANKLMW